MVGDVWELCVVDFFMSPCLGFMYLLFIVRISDYFPGKYVGNRPIKLRKSCWQDRQVENVKRKEKEKKKLGFR